jgi:transposase
MRLTTLFPHLHGLRLVHHHLANGVLTLVVTPIGQAAPCPHCQRMSRRVHSRFQRHIDDLPCTGQPLHLILEARRFSCQTGSCPARTFRERVPALVAPRARRSHGLDAALTQLGMALGGAAGARLAGQLGTPTSADTLLRLVRAAAVPARAPVHALGVDDWAWKRGTRYGTLLCDLARHRVVDLLPDRSADAVAAWLVVHPEVTVISRDRSDLYADGATRGAPLAQQVADRFHLLANLGDALERFLQHKRAVIRQVSLPDPDDAPPAMPLPPWQARAAEDSQRRHAPVVARYAAVIALEAKGADIADIARTTGLSRTTVYRYLRCGCPPGRKQYGPRATVLDPYKRYLLTRWDEGCHTATRLWREIRAQGYPTSYTTVSRFLAHLRLPVGQRPSVHREHRLARPPTPRHIALLCLKHPETLTSAQRTLLGQLGVADPTIASAHILVSQFGTMARERHGADLESWIAVATSSAIPDLRRFATGLRLDLAAVQAGLTEEWSNGQTEGHINRLKTLKRQMYGRAQFDLLRQRFLYHP